MADEEAGAQLQGNQQLPDPGVIPFFSRATQTVVESAVSSSLFAIEILGLGLTEQYAVVMLVLSCLAQALGFLAFYCAGYRMWRRIVLQDTHHNGGWGAGLSYAAAAITIGVALIKFLRFIAQLPFLQSPNVEIGTFAAAAIGFFSGGLVGPLLRHDNP